MSGKAKLSAEEKARIVRKYLAGEINRSEASRQGGVDESVINDWAGQYRSQGILGLCAVEKNSVYSPELKRGAVEDYLTGGQSQRTICEKYRIRSAAVFRDWIKVYNSGRDFKKTRGGCRMKTARKTTQEPAIVRLREDGGYEIVSGHRRQRILRSLKRKPSRRNKEVHYETTFSIYNRRVEW